MNSSDSISHYVGGHRVAGDSGREQDVFNPATGEATARVSLASTEETNAAVAAARAALICAGVLALSTGIAPSLRKTATSV